WEINHIGKVFNDCYGLFDSAIKAVATNDKLMETIIKETLAYRTGFRVGYFHDLPKIIDLCANDKLNLKSFTEQRKFVRREFSNSDEKDGFKYLIKQEYLIRS